MYESRQATKTRRPQKEGLQETPSPAQETWMIKPMGDWVVCKMPKTQEQTKSGLHIPESAQWAPVEALVLAKGPKVTLEIKQGDRVCHEFLAGLEVEDEDWGPVLMLQQKDIQGVLTA